MSKKFKKIVFRATALAAGILCLGAFSCSALNASGPKNAEEAYKSTLEKIEKLRKESLLAYYDECYDLVPIPHASIEKVDGNDKTPEVVVQRMLAFDKNDKDAGNLDTIKDLLGDDRKLFEKYDPNSTENKIDVSIEIYDYSKDREKPANVINAKMRKIPRTINGRNFVEFDLETYPHRGLVMNQVPIGMVKLYKHDGSGRKCISEMPFNGRNALIYEVYMLICGIINFNRNVNEDIKKIVEESLPEYDAKTNTLGKYGKCCDIVPIPRSVGAALVDEDDGTPAGVICRMLAFDKNDKDAGNLNDIKDLLDDEDKLFGEYDPNSTENKIDVSIEIYNFSKDPKNPANVINTKMRKIPRTINGRNFVEFDLEMPDTHGHLITAQVPTGMVMLYKHDGSGRKCIAEVPFVSIGSLSCISDMFIKGIMNFNRDDIAKG